MNAAEGPLERVRGDLPSSLTVTQAEDLASRTLAATYNCIGYGPEQDAANRERVASDLAGLLDCYDTRRAYADHRADHFARYTAGLLRTAALYGVEA